MKPTPEQQDCVDATLTGESVAIVARAGTGKTSTLIQAAHANAGRFGAYVVFNKDNATEAKTRFPGTVKVGTAHSFAYARKAIPFKHKLSSSAPRVTNTQLAEMLGLQGMMFDNPVTREPKLLSASFLASHLKDALSNFCQSADQVPAAAHFSPILGLDDDGKSSNGRGKRGPNNRALAESLLPVLRRAWERTIDPGSAMPFTHDVYLKLWQLDPSPTINADYIMLDEAQDANPVMLDILRRQKGQLILVGDQHQQIYSWRGAINAMESVPVKHRCHLTQSFRFGPAIAEQANEVLISLGETHLIRGTNTIRSSVGYAKNPDAILLRTNAEAVRLAIREVAAGRRPCVTRDCEDVIRFARAADELRMTGKTNFPQLAAFKTWEEVQDYADSDAGGELKSSVKLVDEFGADQITYALSRCVKEEQNPDVILSTAHKSKGREWNDVKIGTDFKDPDAENYSQEESRLLYVALTRAKSRLDPTGCEALATIKKQNIEARETAATPR